MNKEHDIREGFKQKNFFIPILWIRGESADVDKQERGQSMWIRIVLNIISCPEQL